MGHVRRGPKLLPEKLLKLREYLNVGQQEMAQMLETQIESQVRSIESTLDVFQSTRLENVSRFYWSD